MPDSSAPPRFSLKELLLALAAVSGVLGIGIAYGYGPASGLALVASGWMTRVGLREKRHLLTATGFPLMFASGAGVFVAWCSWVVFGVGPVLLPSSYPPQLTSMIETVGADPWKVKVYCHEDFLFRTHVWRMPLATRDVDTIAGKFGMSETSADAIGPYFFKQFPRHWRPRRNPGVTFFGGRDGMGVFYEAAYDPATEHFYVWCEEDTN